MTSVETTNENDGEPKSSPVVLHVRVVSGVGGGPEKTILNSPRYLADHGYRSLCAYMRAPGDDGFEEVAARAKRSAAALLEIDDRGPFDVRVWRQLLHVCREQRVAIWHGHDYKSNAIGLLLRRMWPMKLVTTVHGWVKVTRRTPLYYGIDRFCLKYYDRVVCVTEELRERCLNIGIKPERCVTIVNAIDSLEHVRLRPREEAKRRLGLPSERWLIGSVGRLSNEKGYDRLIDAVAELIRGGADVALAIAGEGDARPRLEQQIRQLQLTDRIQLLGFRADVQDIYDALDVFALSSVREGLPNVLLEAMAAGVPIVATRVAGIPDLIQDGQNGLLVSPGDPGALSARLKELHNNRQLAEQFGERGRQTIEAQHSFQRRMERMAALYDKVLGKSAAELWM